MLEFRGGIMANSFRCLSRGCTIRENPVQPMADVIPSANPNGTLIHTLSPEGLLSFAKIRSCQLSSQVTQGGSYQSDSRISGSSQRSTNIEWCWKSNQRQKTSKLRS
jgi:hypothetical protein